MASYNFKGLKEFIVYYFVYVKENIIVDNKELLEKLKISKEIENLDYNVIIN